MSLTDGVPLLDLCISPCLNGIFPSLEASDVLSADPDLPRASMLKYAYNPTRIAVGPPFIPVVDAVASVPEIYQTIVGANPVDVVDANREHPERFEVRDPVHEVVSAKVLEV